MVYVSNMHAYRINVWYRMYIGIFVMIYLHLPYQSSRCRAIYHTFILWDSMVTRGVRPQYDRFFLVYRNRKMLGSGNWEAEFGTHGIPKFNCHMILRDVTHFNPKSPVWTMWSVELGVQQTIYFTNLERPIQPNKCKHFQIHQPGYYEDNNSNRTQTAGVNTWRYQVVNPGFVVNKDCETLDLKEPLQRCDSEVFV